MTRHTRRARSERHSPEDRSRKLLAAASRLFAQKGFHGTAVNDIIAAGGGSKATLAALFGNKAGIFGAVVASFADRTARDIALTGQTNDVAEGLLAAGNTLLRFYLSKAALQGYRGVITTGPTETEVARRFYHDGHLRIVNALAGLLRQWRGKGLLVCERPEEAADCFCHMLRHGVYEQVLIGLATRVPRAAIRHQAQWTVDAFLNGCARLESTINPAP